MPMKIWHQSTTVLNDVPFYVEAMRKRAKEVAREDTEIIFHGFLPGSFPSDYPASDISFSYLAWLHSNQWVIAALEAERLGYDAVMFANLSAPMLQEARTLVDIPIVAQGEAVCRLAGMYGRRFGTLGFVAGRFDYFPERIREWGLADSFVGVRGIGEPFTKVMATLAGEKTDLVKKIIVAGEKLVNEDGADVIVPAEIPLSLVLAREGITRIADAPIIDGMATVIKVTEMAVDLRRLAGMSVSRHSYFHRAPDKKRLEEALDFYGVSGLRKRVQEYNGE